MPQTDRTIAIGLAARERAIARHLQNGTVPYSFQRRGGSFAFPALTTVLQSGRGWGKGGHQPPKAVSMPEALIDWALKMGVTNERVWAVLRRSRRRRR